MDKVQFENRNDCTSQQAFYKLRNAIQVVTKLDSSKISPSTKLEMILPRGERRLLLRNIEQQLGFKLNVLKPPLWIIQTIISILITSFILFFINWIIALFGILIFMVGLYIAGITKTELKLETIGDVVDKMTKENYIKSRTEQETVNKAEIEKLISDWFYEAFDLEENSLNRDSRFGKA